MPSVIREEVDEGKAYDETRVGGKLQPGQHPETSSQSRAASGWPSTTFRKPSRVFKSEDFEEGISLSSGGRPYSAANRSHADQKVPGGFSLRQRKSENSHPLLRALGVGHSTTISRPSKAASHPAIAAHRENMSEDMCVSTTRFAPIRGSSRATLRNRDGIELCVGRCSIRQLEDRRRGPP